MYSPVSAEEAVKVIKSNNRVYIHAAAAAPQALIKAMANRHEELRNVEVCQLHPEG
jgi:acyl-CoA hydrolase